jgi:hypothetical protein
MMLDVVRELAERGIELRLAGDQIQLRPAAALTSDLTERLQAIKPQLIQQLRGESDQPADDVHAAYGSVTRLMLDRVNRACPQDWRGSEDNHRLLDKMESEVIAARQVRDWRRFLAALTQYEQAALAVFRECEPHA